MANKQVKKVRVDKNVFLSILKEKRISIRRLGSSAYYEVTQRNEKSIRRFLNDGAMPEEVLDNIAMTINVDPRVLSGAKQKETVKIDDPFFNRFFPNKLNLEDYPYIRKAIEDVDYPSFFQNALTLNLISTHQFKSLDLRERVLLHQELAVAITEVMAKHFKTDSLGRDFEESLDYLHSMEGTFDPFSYFAELEGVRIEPNKQKIDDDDYNTTRSNEDERKLKEKYSFIPENN